MRCNYLGYGTKLFQRILSNFNFRLERLDKINDLGERSHFYDLWKNWIDAKNVPTELLIFILKNSHLSYSQIQQDLLALWISKSINVSKQPFFVEFGATNGKNLSNTYLLEKNFGWTGILAEPGQNWHSELKKNRSCLIDTRCVYSSSDRFVEFAEAKEGEYSTIFDYISADSHSSERKKHKVYKVRTVSLNDLLDQYSAPSHINYMSIDTEGSEYEILSCFPFEKYAFDFISVEHNYNQNRDHIKEILENASYIRILPEVSQFEDWYVSQKMGTAFLNA